MGAEVHCAYKTATAFAEEDRALTLQVCNCYAAEDLAANECKLMLLQRYTSDLPLSRLTPQHRKLEPK